MARRISEGKIESRLENGRREVFVCLPDEPVADAPESAADTSVSQVSATTVLANANPAPVHEAPVTTLTIAEDREADIQERLRTAELTAAAFQKSAELSQGDVRRARLGALVAWGMVAALVTAVVSVTGWTASKITRAETHAEYLEHRLSEVAADTDKFNAAQAELRKQVEDARIAKAKAEGKLEILTAAQAAQAHAPKPAPSLLDKMASLLESDGGQR